MRSDLYLSHRGNVYQVLFSDQIMLFSVNDAFAFDVKVDQKNSWTFSISFTNDDNKRPLAVNTKLDTERNIDIFLNKWYSDDWIESHPIIYKAKSGKFETITKIRSICKNANAPHRLVYINVWKRELKDEQ